MPRPRRPPPPADTLFDRIAEEHSGPGIARRERTRATDALIPADRDRPPSSESADWSYGAAWRIYAARADALERAARALRDTCGSALLDWSRGEVDGPTAARLIRASLGALLHAKHTVPRAEPPPRDEPVPWAFRAELDAPPPPPPPRHELHVLYEQSVEWAASNAADLAERLATSLEHYAPEGADA